MTLRVMLEVTAAIIGIALAAWSGPTVRQALAPQIEIICPVCGGPR